MKIHLTAIIQSKAEHLAEVKAVLQNMVRETRHEKACLQYDLHQSIDSETTFVFYEIWESAEGLALHEAQPYMQAFRSFIPDKLMEKPEIYKTILL